MANREYRRLTANERQYLIDNYDDDPNAIAQIAAHLRKEPRKILDHARYLKLRKRSSRHAWSESELTLLDDFAETMPLNLLVAAWNRLAKKEGRPTRKSAIAGKEVNAARTFPQTLRRLLIRVGSSNGA